MLPPKPAPTVIGRRAEDQAAHHLIKRGFVILDRNWRNRWCELDIVARHIGQLHVIEVKYRRTTTWGAGYDYITPDKSARLARAALAWTQAHHYTGPYQIDVITIAGPLDQPAIQHLPNISAGW